MFNRILLRVIWREYLLWSVMFTLISCFWLVRLGPAGLINVLWIKVIGCCSILLYLYFWRRKYLYLFYNQGLSRRRILVLALIADLLLSIPLWTVTLLFNPFISSMIRA